MRKGYHMPEHADLGDYPAELRAELERHRKNGRPFDLAWDSAITTCQPPENWVSELAFIRKHFEAAYNREQSSYGRLRIAAPDTSTPVVRLSTPSTKPRRCRSGDGCDRLATTGRFGLMWCDWHGAELERLHMEPSTIRWDGREKVAA